MSARRVRLTIEGERVGGTGVAHVVRVKYGPNASVLVDTTHDTVTVEDIVPPRVWTDGDVVQGGSVWERRGGEWWAAIGRGATADIGDHEVDQDVASGHFRVLRYQAGEGQ